MNKFLRRKLVLEMEVQMKLVAFYQAMMNRAVNKGTVLSSSKLLKLSLKHDQHLVKLLKLKTQYQQAMKDTFKYCEHKRLLDKMS